MKKISSVILSLSLILCSFSGCSEKSTQESEPEETKIPVNDASDFVYTEEGEGIKITGYKGSSVTVNIPAEIDGKPVLSVGEYAFDGFEKAPEENNGSEKAYQKNNINSIVSLHIPGSIKTIETGAFTNCYSLTEVVFSEGVESLGEGAFACCDQITSVSLPDSLCTIDSFVFYECYKLSEVSFGKNTESIGNYAFYNCKNLGHAELPNSVKSIGEGCFSACDMLTEIKLSDSMEEIPENAFVFDSSLKNLTIPKNITRIKEKAFMCCPQLTGMTIPETVTSIGDFALGYTQKQDENNPEKLTEIPEENFTLKVKKGSAAEAYAIENNISYK